MWRFHGGYRYVVIDFDESKVVDTTTNDTVAKMTQTRKMTEEAATSLRLSFHWEPVRIAGIEHVTAASRPEEDLASIPPFLSLSSLSHLSGVVWCRSTDWGKEEEDKRHILYGGVLKSK